MTLCKHEWLDVFAVSPWGLTLLKRVWVTQRGQQALVNMFRTISKPFILVVIINNCHVPSTTKIFGCFWKWGPQDHWFPMVSSWKRTRVRISIVFFPTYQVRVSRFYKRCIPSSSSSSLSFSSSSSSSTASCRQQWALPDLNRELQISVGTAGPQPLPTPGPRPWGLDELQVAVGATGPQPRAPQPRGPGPQLRELEMPWWGSLKVKYESHGFLMFQFVPMVSPTIFLLGPFPSSVGGVCSALPTSSLTAIASPSATAAERWLAGCFL